MGLSGSTKQKPYKVRVSECENNKKNKIEFLKWKYVHK